MTFDEPEVGSAATSNASRASSMSYSCVMSGVTSTVPSMSAIASVISSTKRVRAHRAGDPQGGLGRVGRVHMAGATGLGGGDGECPDGAGPRDEDRTPGHVAGPLDGVERHPEGLCQRAVLGAHPRWERAHLVWTDEAVPGEAALLVGLERGGAEVADLRPQVRPRPELVGEGEVPHQRGGVHRDLVADREALDIAADLGDRPGHLMAEHERVAEHGGAGDARRHIGDVGTADTAPLHRDQDVVRPADRVGDLVDADIPCTVDNHCLHDGVPPQSIFCSWSHSPSAPTAKTAMAEIHR